MIEKYVVVDKIKNFVLEEYFFKFSCKIKKRWIRKGRERIWRIKRTRSQIYWSPNIEIDYFYNDENDPCNKYNVNHIKFGF